MATPRKERSWGGVAWDAVIALAALACVGFVSGLGWSLFYAGWSIATAWLR
jgi:hypothetical protein